MECHLKASQTNKKIYNVGYNRQKHIKTVKMNNIIYDWRNG